MRSIYLLTFAVIAMSCGSVKDSSTTASTSDQAIPANFHEFTVKDIYGADYTLSQLKGKKVMVVNTASKCGLTPQYEQLEDLYKEHGGEDFVIIGFPANNFMGQEPGSDEEIEEFCKANYGVSFPMMSKISVKGDDMHPLYQWLTQKKHNGVEDVEVQWNFQKFLIDEEGKYIKTLSPRTLPNDQSVIDWINGKDSE